VSYEAISQTIDERQHGATATGRRRGRWFFGGFAITTACTVFVGFARTYYFKNLVPTAPMLPLAFHIHGALFTTWILLFISQAFLIAHKRISVHRRLGVVSGLLVVPMVVTGAFVAIAAAKGQGPLSSAVARGEFSLALPQIPPLTALVIPLASVTLFAAFVVCGLIDRRTPDSHKRYMALAAIAMLPPALGRALATIVGVANPGLFFGATVLFIAAIVIHDRRTRGRVHPVTLWGGLVLVASFPARLALGTTDLWLTFASWLTTRG
jgi:multisubunit Na+/H+ antiporter MnhC subunit